MELRILSWNILAPMWVVPRLYDSVPPELLVTAVRIQKIIKTLKQKNANILMLQEFQSSNGCPDMEPLWEYLEDNYILANFAVFKDNCGDGYLTRGEWLSNGGYQDHGNAIWIQKSSNPTYSILHGEEYLVDTYGFIASIVILQLRCEEDGEVGAPSRLMLVNCHLNWGLGRTVKQIKSINKRIQELLKIHKMDLQQPAVIWAGDFNRGRNSRVNKKMKEFGYLDITVESDGQSDHKTFLGSAWRNRRLDYIFISKFLQGCSSHSFMIDEVPEKYDVDEAAIRSSWGIGTFGSDHLSVLGSLNFHNNKFHSKL